MVKIISQAFGGDEKSDGVKVNDMGANSAVSQLNNFFGAG